MMFAFLVAAALVSTTIARPEAGYNYPRPSPNIPSNRYGQPGGTYVTGSHAGVRPSVGGVYTGTTGGGYIGGGTTGGGYIGGGTTGGGYIGGGTTGGGYIGGGTTGGGSFIGGTSGGGFIGGTTGGGGSIGGITGGGVTSTGFGSINTGGQFGTSQTSFIGNQGSLIHKHIYVHVAPPDLELQQRQEIRSAATAQKHYKIIFIKTPSQSTSSVQQIQAQAQNQEKTLIYVLVKKPDDAQQVALTTATSSQPSKPEVYFIRYKAATATSGVGSNGGTGVDQGVVGGIGGGGGFGGGGSSNVKVPQPSGGGGGFGGGFTSGGSSFASADTSSVKSPQISASYGAPSPQTYGPPGQSGPY